MEKEHNPITSEELRAALAEQPYDLSGRLLVGVRLERCDLEGLYLRGATLRGCTFAHCKFDNSDFTDADLGDTQFIRCKMEYCFFDGAKQEGAAFDLCARFGSTGIDGDTRTQSEVIFDDNIGIVRGVDMANAPGWRDFAWTMCDSVEEDYDIMLWELQEKFHEIDEAYPGMGAEIFNNGLHFLPHELRGAANYIAQGNSVEAAHRQALDWAFSYGDRLPEHEMFVFPHSDVQKNLLAERAFLARVQAIRGVDFGKLNDWLGIARDLSEADGGVYDHAHYRQLLKEYGDAFEEISQDDAEVASALFNYPAAYLPHEMFTVAEWIGNGGSPEEAYETFTAQMDLSAAHEKHTLWRQGDPDGVCADFSGRELKNLTFYGTTFDGAKFTGAHLINCWMYETSFTQCDFSETSFLDVSAIGADFSGSVFDGAVLQRSIFQGAYLEGASFAGAALTACDFQGADMEAVDFSHAVIQQCEGLEDMSSGPAMAM